jgi:AcrR family transcriptional regulator
MVDRAPVRQKDTPRRQQQKDALRLAILTAARTIARSEGWQSVTIRKVADTIGYSHPTLYEFFEDKNALLLELHREGFRQLSVALNAARLQIPDATHPPVEMALAYCNFAWQHYELYQVMHSLGGAQITEFQMTREGEAVISEARAAIETWALANKVTVCNADDAVLILWSTLHGIASLALAKQMIGGKKHAALLVVQAVEGLFAAWQLRNCV